ncbi:MAG: IS4 family transposase [Betaproteobacteria bacterium]|nr:IS4 family transposase [Betaproteobacteria bacterium]
MALWIHWWNAICLLRPAYARTRSFMWFATAVAGMTVRTDLLGVTSIVRALKLHPRFYDRLLDGFHSKAIRPDALVALWARVVLRLFPDPVRVNGRLVLVGDGIKAPKRGKKMPAVKLLHQQSDSNKPEYIMGHSLQAVSILMHAAKSVFAVPLAMRIHEGVVWSNLDRRTLLDKMLALLDIVDIEQAYYFVADAYYAAGKIIKGLLDRGNHLISRMRSNAVAYVPHIQSGPRKKGRPRIYAKKIALKALFKDKQALQQIPSPVYGEETVTLQYRTCDLLWRPAARIVRFVAVIHPTRGCILLMCTDITLSVIEIIRLYGLRFKIEHTFKQAVRVIGTLAYHFWMMTMKPLRRKNGNQYLHREPLDYRDAVKRKINAYHQFIQAGIVSQGLVQYLAAAFPQLVWNSFGSWLRTIRPGIPPSELVVATALRQCLPQFLLDTAESNSFAKFIVDRQDPDKMGLFRLAG